MTRNIEVKIDDDNSIELSENLVQVGPEIDTGNNTPISCKNLIFSIDTKR